MLRPAAVEVEVAEMIRGAVSSNGIAGSVVAPRPGRHRSAATAFPVWVAALVAVVAGLPGPTLGSEGTLVEVVQPMFLSGSTAFVLHAVTYVEDIGSAAPGREIELIGRPNAVSASRPDPATGLPVAINTNVANLLGLVLRARGGKDVTNAKRGSDGMLLVDTVEVEIDV